MNYRDTQRLVDSGFVPEEVLVEYSKNVHMICEAYVRGDITHEQKEELMLENKRNFFSKKSDEKWKYKVDLIDGSVFDEIEKKYGVKISSGFKRFIKKHNGATPVNYKVKVGEKDRVVGAILSFNKNEKDADSAFLALDGLKGTGLLPFAIDPFGNYFCIKDGKVVFWNHETNEITETGKSLSKFASDLNSNTMTESEKKKDSD